MGSGRRPARATRHRRSISLRAALLSTALVDELTTGLLIVGLPLVRDRLHLSYEQAGLLFTAGGLSSLALDPLISLLSDRGAKRRAVLFGTLGLALGFAVAGAAPSYLWLLLAFGVLFPASGAAVNVAQAALVDMAPGGVGRMMVRWEVLAGAGDLLAPVAIGLLVGAGVQWPALCLGAAGCWLVPGVLIAPHRFPEPVALSPDESGDTPGTLAVLRLALRDRMLLRWVGVELCCTMLDEVFVGFVALYVHDRLGATAGEAGIVLLPGAVGAVLSLIVLERILTRVNGVRLLPVLALLALGGVIILLTAPSLWIAGIGLTIAAIGAAGWYPIARAAAYDRYPGHPGLVHAVLGVGTPVELVLPGAVGLVAAHLGIRAGVAILGLAPFGVLLLAPRRVRRDEDAPTAVRA